MRHAGSDPLPGTRARRTVIALASAVLTLPSCGGKTTDATSQTSPRGDGGGAGTGKGAAGSGASAGASGAGGQAGGAGASSGSSDFPVGTYTTCVEGVHARGPNGGAFLNGAGFQATSTLTIARTGDTLSADYVDQNGKATKLSFHLVAGDVALLSSPVTAASETGALCVLGPGNETFGAATMTVSSGAMTYDSGSVLLALDGVLDAQVGTCGAVSSPGSFWIVCEDGPAPPSAPITPAPAPALPLGTLSCVSQMGTMYTYQGQKQLVTSGGDKGTLTLSLAGDQVTADYSGDVFVSGALSLTLTSETTAAAHPSSTVTTPCLVPVNPPSNLPETLPLSFASLVVDGANVFLAFDGVMPEGSSCPGARKAGALLCTKDP